jgi:predicted translin family RNA/ssDNA-binding protein
MYEQLMQAFKDLKIISQDERGRKNGLFEIRRANIGKAYFLAGEIRRLSKEMIAALLDGADETEVDEIEREMHANMRSLVELDLPADIAWQHQAEAGQEYVEAKFVRILFAVVADGKNLPATLPLPADFLVTEPAWLAGIGDAVTETSKLVTDILLNEKLSRDERIAIRKRFISVSQDIYDALSNFETALPAVINNSRRRGYSNSFRGMLGRIRGAIGWHKEKLADALDRLATK